MTICPKHCGSLLLVIIADVPEVGSVDGNLEVVGNDYSSVWFAEALGLAVVVWGHHC